jgi:hypothetical protein
MEGCFDYQLSSDVSSLFFKTLFGFYLHILTLFFSPSSVIDEILKFVERRVYDRRVESVKSVEANGKAKAA